MINDIGLKVEFKQDFLTKNEADIIYNYCDKLNWGDSLRETLLFGDEGLVYTVLGQYIVVNPWSFLIDLKDKVENITFNKFNFCAVTRYVNGLANMPRHRDREVTGAICGISVGEERQFKLSTWLSNKHFILNLNHGSLYCMYPPTNDKWLHEILKSDTPYTRYSLTFRNSSKPLTITQLNDKNKKCRVLLKSGQRKGLPCDAFIYNDNQSTCNRHKIYN